MSQPRLYQIRRRPAPWRSLEEWEAGPPGDSGEFPPGAADRFDLDRRRFMQLAGATLGLPAAGCTRGESREILPYTKQPPEITPGVSSFYATSLVLDGYATGLVVESRDGRPIKVDGNPRHPATAGGSNLFQQATVRQLYDDQRARRPRRGSAPVSWPELLAELGAPRRDEGAGLRILLEPTSSPLLLALLARVRARLPAARFAFYSAFGHHDVDTDHRLAGAQVAFGQPLLAQHQLAEADVILAFDSDFLAGEPLSLRLARQWAERRRLSSAAGEMNRLYVVESLLSVTGSMADHRLPRPLAEIPAVLRAVAAALPGLPTALRTALAPGEVSGDNTWARTVARDLASRPPGRTAVLVGERLPPLAHALGHVINERLGNLGRSVAFTAPVVPLPDGKGQQSFAELLAELHGGKVETLVIVEANPLYSAPAALRFAEALARAQHSYCFSYHEHETAARCRSFGPTTHLLESWGDARAADGTVSFIQPLILPLVDARTDSEVLAALAGAQAPQARRLLHEHWRGPGGLDESALRQAIQRGLLEGSGSARQSVAPAMSAVTRALERGTHAAATGGLALELSPSPTLYDGRFANNPWLQEQPDPLSKLTWDNAAMVSAATARRLGLRSEDVVALEAQGQRVRAPVLVVPGLADDVVAAHVGYGRAGQEALAAGVGFNAFALRPGLALGPVAVRVEKLPGRHRLARTQLHFSLHGRPIAERRTLAAYRADPHFTAAYKGALTSVLPAFSYRGPQWAMSIDLSICTGCSACMLGCQSENNLLIVGKDNVLLHRQMHWLRIDTYFTGTPEAPAPVHQPMLCQHCEKAPCEYVCPVNATTHSPDGLNEMAYNRCVGTRFCSNNCPYKVRRFNWFDWGERVAANRGLSDLQYNPDVTVRERGVMEKCTYCVQRIREAEIAARIERRDIQPGEVVTACQAACPTGAIQFGSLHHPDTPMVRWRQQDRSYAVLHDQGTQPRTHYLARIDNPNPELGEIGQRGEPG
jgi:molybdopterin-containing oxidoreductase family iron-sulfur binding subunit